MLQSATPISSSPFPLHYSMSKVQVL